MNKKEAYKIVLADLKTCSLYCGTYDASHGNEHFMYGVGSVMETIAYRAGDEVGDAFSDAFNANMVLSEAIAEKQEEQGGIEVESYLLYEEEDLITWFIAMEEKYKNSPFKEQLRNVRHAMLGDSYGDEDSLEKIINGD